MVKVIFFPFQVSTGKLILSSEFHHGNKENAKKYPKTKWDAAHPLYLPGIIKPVICRGLGETVEARRWGGSGGLRVHPPGAPAENGMLRGPLLCEMNASLINTNGPVQHGAVYRLEPRLPGGRGWGSMLRALAAQIGKAASREARRDQWRDCEMSTMERQWRAG